MLSFQGQKEPLQLLSQKVFLKQPLQKDSQEHKSLMYKCKHFYFYLLRRKENVQRKRKKFQAGYGWCSRSQARSTNSKMQKWESHSLHLSMTVIKPTDLLHLFSFCCFVLFFLILLEYIWCVCLKAFKRRYPTYI